jgi:hypothetical protein
MEDVAYVFHFQPSELAKMKVRQLIKWHRAADRINKQLGKK